MTARIVARILGETRAMRKLVFGCQLDGKRNASLCSICQSGTYVTSRMRLLEELGSVTSSFLPAIHKRGYFIVHGLRLVGRSFFGCGAVPCAGFEPGVFIDNAIRLDFASTLSTCTFTIWPTLTTSLGSLM